jgi:hypothetical protein
MSQFFVKPQGTYRGMVCARLLTPEGRRVECAEQWIHRDYNRKVWGRYVSGSGESWWLDHSAVLDLKESAKGKRKPFSVEIEPISPPPSGAICAVKMGV